MTERPKLTLLDDPAVQERIASIVAEAPPLTDRQREGLLRAMKRAA